MNCITLKQKIKALFDIIRRMESKCFILLICFYFLMSGHDCHLLQRAGKSFRIADLQQ